MRNLENGGRFRLAEAIRLPQPPAGGGWMERRVESTSGGGGQQPAPARLQASTLRPASADR